MSKSFIFTVIAGVLTTTMLVAGFAFYPKKEEKEEDKTKNSIFVETINSDANVSKRELNSDDKQVIIESDNFGI